MVDKQSGLRYLNEELQNQSILLIAPGYTSKACEKEIQKYIDEIHPVVITINFLHETIHSDYVYMSNVKRYQTYKDNRKFLSCRKILASNVKNQVVEDNEIIVSFSDLIKCGWEHMDNSTILLLRLLDKVENLQSIAIAGFDGYEATRTDETNYVSSELEKSIVQDEPDKINEEIISMLQDYKATRLHMQVPVTFVTESRFSYIFE
jgi:4-hydroxy 2-oxovalerate aldolase